ncbi:MAG TPA: tRNA dihydrouridine(20/20a) synthase DusA [Steroidobacteraceae bacterium]|nr:tRNA dihydrouridine(20/20a) synthase DusA [Steroidobacteraceae bacterium]
MRLTSYTSPTAVGEVAQCAGEGWLTRPAADLSRPRGRGTAGKLTPVTRATDPAARPLDRRLCVAPMMDYTDRHCRYLLRLLSPRALLYTEMVTAQALAHGDVERLLGYDATEHPVALQLGGSDPALLARAARFGELHGYDEINLNVGCPSDRVQSGRFGACLMAEPGLVADCMRAMREAVRVPVTVKCRIGIDDRDDYEFFDRFVQTVRAAGVDVFIVHARKAHLQGLSPRENREVPPLRYEVAARLKAEHPELTVILNGGLTSAAQVREWLPRFDGVMLGRQAYQEPYLLAQLDVELLAPGLALPARESIVLRYADYVDRMLALGHRLPLMLRHVHGLYAGLPHARSWRRFVTEQGQLPGASGDVLRRSLAMFRAAA